MPISERELLDQYGGAVTAGNAALFIGAGLSLSSGYPGWAELLDGPRSTANIPDDLKDLPLVAQYFVEATPGGRETLEAHILTMLGKVIPTVTPGYAELARLPVDDIWTTNYDCLVEKAIPGISVVASDADLKERRRLGRRRAMKMHGSLTMAQPLGWKAPPVITRRDYEEYEGKYPRLWAALRATYLTRSLLFLGFSFTDPNIDVLLRLSRTLLRVGAPEHFTVMRRPSEPDESRLYELQVADLEKSGVAVHQITEWKELDPLLGRLVRRTRPKLLFVSGSQTEDSDILECCRRLGNRLAEWNLMLTSLAGKAAMITSYAFGRTLLAEERYDPQRIRFYFRGKKEKPPPLEERIGTVTYTALQSEELRRSILSECRAAIILGGGSNTEHEVELARKFGVPVIPLARSGGAARRVWNAISHEQSGISLKDTDDERQNWALLNHEDVDIATSAAVRLVTQAMFLQPVEDHVVGGTG
jgi:SIR2-like domain